MRNVALSPRQSAGTFVVLALASLIVAAPFVALGAWPILPFAGVEIAALAVAFGVYALHATDGDRVVLEPGRVRVEARRGRRTTVTEFPAPWVRVDVERGRRVIVRLHARRQCVRIGDCVVDARRERFAHELKRALRGGAAADPARAGAQDRA